MGSNGRGDKHRRVIPRPPPLSLLVEREQEELAVIMAVEPVRNVQAVSDKRLLSKQLSMKETTREVKWEKRRRQIHRRRSNSSKALQVQDVVAVDEATANANVEAIDSEATSSGEGVLNSLTDGDLDELRGSMELGFGFNEETGGQNLCTTLPALDLYFAVNRQLSEPKMRRCTSALPSPTRTTSSTRGASSNPCSPVSQSSFMDSWKICSPGENPQLVKTRLRHWAQVVACSVKHSS